MSQVMDLSRKMYQLPVLERIADTDWNGGNSSPLVVELDPTAACDLACPGCISEDIIAAGGRFSDERLMSLGKEMIIAGVRAVILIGGGEPLAHRKAGDLITLLGRHGVRVGITTNGTFMDRHIDAIAAYSSWTRVSLDAATEQTYSALRPTKGGGNNKFARVLDNMRQLACIKTGKMGFSFLIQTGADGVVMSNIHEIYAAALLARDLGCDYFEVKPSYQFRGGVNHSLMVHDKKLMAEAAEEVGRLDALETSTFKILRAINLRASLEGVETPQPKDYHRCPATHLRTTVTPGGVYVCPYWRGKDRMRVGDVTALGFEAMWGGELRQKVMERLDPSKDCNFHCLRHDTNLLALELKRRLTEAGAEVVPVEEFDLFI
jgi:MoaA/NifB/PqqE/SkfB family radical SAM enzyme